MKARLDRSATGGLHQLTQKSDDKSKLRSILSIRDQWGDRARQRVTGAVGSPGLRLCVDIIGSNLPAIGRDQSLKMPTH